MAQPLNANDLVALPTLDAQAGIALSLQLENATLDDNDKPRKLPENVKAALHDVQECRGSLQEEVGAAPAAEAEIAATDQLVDAVLRALYYLFKAWEILIDILPEGEEAAELRSLIYGEEGLRIINLPADVEWGVVDTKLKLIDDQKLAPRIAALGAAKMLTYLRDVQVRYGEVTGKRAEAAALSPQVRVKLQALSDAIRHYVTAVIGSVVRKKPETKELADTLLQPLANWSRSKPKRKPKTEGGKAGPEGAGPKDP